MDPNMYFIKIWEPLGRCGSVTKKQSLYSVLSEHVQIITCTGFSLIKGSFPSTKMLTQGIAISLQILFLHLISYT